MRIPFTDIVITRRRTIDAEISTGGAAVARRRASAIVKLFAKDESCLRHAIAARLQADERNLFVTKRLLRSEARAIAAFLDRVDQLRTGVLP